MGDGAVEQILDVRNGEKVLEPIDKRLGEVAATRDEFVVVDAGRGA